MDVIERDIAIAKLLGERNRLVAAEEVEWIAGRTIEPRRAARIAEISQDIVIQLSLEVRTFEHLRELLRQSRGDKALEAR